MPAGTTLNDFGLQVIKRIAPNLGIERSFDLEHWMASVYFLGSHTGMATTIQLTWLYIGKLVF